MDFRLDEDQRALRAGMRELLARHTASAAREPSGPPARGGEGTVRAVWRELGAAGFFALRLPEADGGVGLGLPEAALVFEEAGRSLLPGPLVATHLAAGGVPGAAEGDTPVTAMDLGQARGDPDREVLVAHLDVADVVMAVDGASTRTLPASVVRSAARSVRSVDPGTALDVVPLRSLPPAAAFSAPQPSAARGPEETGAAADPGAAARRFRAEAKLLSAAQQLGSAARTVETAVEHARRRTQFGRPIGSFQAVQHLCAEMLVRVEVARAAVYAAAVLDAPTEIAAAGLLADEAAVRNARDCLQIYGGMGFTWESDVHLHLKRAWVRAELWGTAAEAEEHLAAALLAEQDVGFVGK
ncbi:acyl-CoA dehydrogenase family protein [Streptomyces sp. XD-27]|uniref:acyl-CoA dehydrogenase family protein n=1 Tax=Streptomyces sp. XD-27 TaxID=3062779 RepID=UPI0026F44D69|nr:acyl-CoA dehydrogenase family protein [Streptomyces sp. XD-27]WKX72075.1 acyl-CoA dehydrogenase family protein [Streptomyces sp. XD-27]